MASASSKSTLAAGTNYNFPAADLVGSTLTVTPAPLTITAVSDTKTYDGTTAAAAIPIVSGLVGTDTVTGLSETFSTGDVGTGKALSVAATPSTTATTAATTRSLRLTTRRAW